MLWGRGWGGGHSQVLGLGFSWTHYSLSRACSKAPIVYMCLQVGGGGGDGIFDFTSWPFVDPVQNCPLRSRHDVGNGVVQFAEPTSSSKASSLAPLEIGRAAQWCRNGKAPQGCQSGSFQRHHLTFVRPSFKDLEHKQPCTLSELESYKPGEGGSLFFG